MSNWWHRRWFIQYVLAAHAWGPELSSLHLRYGVCLWYQHWGSRDGCIPTGLPETLSKKPSDTVWNDTETVFHTRVNTYACATAHTHAQDHMHPHTNTPSSQITTCYIVENRWESRLGNSDHAVWQWVSQSARLASHPTMPEYFRLLGCVHICHSLKIKKSTIYILTNRIVH